MTQYKQPSTYARIAFFLFFSMAFGLLILLEFHQPDSSGKSVQDLIDRAFRQSVIATSSYLALSVLVLVLSSMAIKERQWPLKKMPVPFRIKITEIRNPWKIWLAGGFIVVMFLFQIAISWLPYIALKNLA